MASSVERYPSGFGRLLCAFDFYLSAIKEVVVIGSPDSLEMQALLAEIWTPYLPNKVVVQGSPADAESAAFIPLLRDRPQLENRATAFVCEHFVCKKPTTSPAELATQLGNVTGSAASS
jgi:uncharacterized protein YyaL (SSP411 family)